jgi:hypothetical protein
MVYAQKALTYPDLNPQILLGRPDIHFRERYLLPQNLTPNPNFTIRINSMHSSKFNQLSCHSTRNIDYIQLHWKMVWETFGNIP